MKADYTKNPAIGYICERVNTTNTFIKAFLAGTADGLFQIGRSTGSTYISIERLIDLLEKRRKTLEKIVKDLEKDKISTESYRLSIIDLNEIIDLCKGDVEGKEVT